MSSAADARGASLAITVPSGLTPGDLSPPDLSRSPQLAVEQWQSARDGSGHVALAWACIGGDASAWNADATEIAQGKLAEIASATAARMSGRATPMHVTSTSQEGRARALVADRGPDAVARTFVAFTREGGATRAHGCFVACVDGSAAGGTSRTRVDGSAACDGALASAHPTGALVDPPAPGLVLGTLSLAVHHPHGALAGLGAVLALGAALAVATRPGRPRRHRRSGPKAG